MKLNPNQRTKLERLFARLANPDQLNAHYLQQLGQEVRLLADRATLQQQPVDLSPLTYFLSDLSSALKELKSDAMVKELKAMASVLKEIKSKPDPNNQDIIKALKGLSDSVGRRSTVTAGGIAAHHLDRKTYVQGQDSFVPGGGVFNDSLDDLDAGHGGAYRMTAKRAVHVNMRAADGTEISPPTNYAQETGGNLATIKATTDKLDATVAQQGAATPANTVMIAGRTGTDSSTLGTAVIPSILGSDADSRPATASGNLLSRAYHYLFNGTTWDRARGDTTNGLWVNIKSAVSLVLAAGSAIIGKVGIDQTTDGTTNKVYVGNAPTVKLSQTTTDNDVDVVSLPATPAGTNLIGRVSASPETSTIYNGTTALTPKFVAIAAGGSGTNDILAAVTSKKIRVLALAVVANAQTDIYFLDDTPTTIFGGSTNKMSIAQYGGFVLPFNPAGWFETAAGKKLQVNLSAANKLSGGLTYVEV